MTKHDFIKRCETAYDLGLVTPDTLKLMETWLDAMMRYEGSLAVVTAGFSTTIEPKFNSQGRFFDDIIEKERFRTNNFQNILVRDVDGYKIVTLSSLLTHPCQICAESIRSSHTKHGFCNHTEKERLDKLKYNERKYKLSKIINNGDNQY